MHWLKFFIDWNAVLRDLDGFAMLTYFVSGVNNIGLDSEHFAQHIVKDCMIIKSYF